LARLASEEKGGYYPTPFAQVELIAKRLRAAPGSPVRLLDPCAGKGEALAAFAEALKVQGARVETYGVEIEKTRARKAAQVLDRVLCAPYEDVHVTPGAFSFLWLNPPYNDKGGERAETAFLRDLSDKLQPGGLLGFCIPQKVLRDAAALLANRFEGLRVYRFTEPDYWLYRQAVAFGYRRTKRAGDPGPERERLRALAWASLPPLDAPDGVVFEVPPAVGEVKTFRADVLNPDEVREVLEGSPVWEDLRALAPEGPAELKPPVLPLRPAHMAIAVAAGAVGGNMGTHLLVGASKRRVTTEVLPDEEGEVRVTRSETVSVVRVFDRNGIHVLE